jgi:hypothetical protein
MIEITIDVELQQNRRMVRRPACGLGISATKLKRRQIKPSIKTSITRTGVLAYPIFQALRKQRALLAIHAFNEAPHSDHSANREGIMRRESPRTDRFYTTKTRSRPQPLFQLFATNDKSAATGARRSSLRLWRPRGRCRSSRTCRPARNRRRHLRPYRRPTPTRRP